MSDTTDLPSPLTRDAVALAHHRYYCHKGGHTCAEVDEFDLDFADTLAEILALIPPMDTEMTPENMNHLGTFDPATGVLHRTDRQEWKP